MKKTLLFVVAILISVSGMAQKDNSEESKLGAELIKTRQYKDAYQVFSEAAKKSNSYAQYSLGYLYVNGYGVEKNYDKILGHCP